MNDWEYSKKIQKKHGSKYYMATRFFPKKVRFATYALYAWVRELDDIVDETSNKIEAKNKFESWIIDWRKTESGETSTRPEMRAFMEVVRSFNIKQEYTESFISSMRMDLEKTEYANIEELENYMYGSATVVGLMMMQIVGDFKEEAVPYAKAMAEAMQLGNFLRDVKDDYDKRDRIYMPCDDLALHNLSIEDIKKYKLSIPFVKFKIAQARRLFEHAEHGIRLLPKKARFPILLASRLYMAVLDEIEKQNYDVFKKRASVNIWQKIIITFKTFLWYQKNM